MNRTIGILGASLVVLSLTACSTSSPGDVPTASSAHFTSGGTSTSSNHSTVDGPVFSSVEELASTSELVVEGTFIKQVGESTDGTLSNSAGSPGLPLVVWEFAVTKVTKGDDTLKGKTIRVAQFDFSKVSSDDLSNAASSNADAYLFLRGFADDATYAVVGTGQGALLVDGSGELATAPNATSGLADQVDRLDTTSDVDDLVDGS